MGFENLLEVWGAIDAAVTAIKALRAFGDSETFQNNRAYLLLKVKQGPHKRSPYPVLIERLDDGSDPLHQILHLDVAPAFPQGRIDQALRYMHSPYYEDILQALGEEIGRRAKYGLSPDADRDCLVEFVLLRGSGLQTFLFRCRIGSEWKLVRKTSKSSWRKILAFAVSNAKMSEQLRKEARTKREQAKSR